MSIIIVYNEDVGCGSPGSGSGKRTGGTNTKTWLLFELQSRRKKDVAARILRTIS